MNHIHQKMGPVPEPSGNLSTEEYEKEWIRRYERRLDDVFKEPRSPERTQYIRKIEGVIKRHGARLAVHYGSGMDVWKDEKF